MNRQLTWFNNSRRFSYSHTVHEFIPSPFGTLRTNSAKATAFASAAQSKCIARAPSGSGKTTLLRCIAGLETPDDGEIIISGQTVFSKRERIYVPPEDRQIGMVFQSYAIWPHMTVFDNVAPPLTCGRKRIRKHLRRSAATRASWAMAE